MFENGVKCGVGEEFDVTSMRSVLQVEFIKALSIRAISGFPQIDCYRFVSLNLQIHNYNTVNIYCIILNFTNTKSYNIKTS